MRKIAIIGAGQAGLQLGIGLAGSGYDVTLVTNRTAEQIRNGRVMSSQLMFGAALLHERALGLNFWDEVCPRTEGFSLAVPDGEGGKALSWSARLDAFGQSVDQRVKYPAWLVEFERRGGKIVYENTTVGSLENIAREVDLVIVASGKGEMAQLFERDPARCTYDSPQRALALTYVTGANPVPTLFEANLIVGVGEYVMIPALTVTGPCQIMIFFGVPGGPMDCWGDVRSPAEHLERSRWIIDTYVPWETERCREVRLTDDKGVLAGQLVPTVRVPVGKLPSGTEVLGMGDVVVLNDPITAQGSNNASKCAASYLASILEHGDRRYDRTFMQSTFDRFWDYAQYSTAFTNAMLAPPPEHAFELLAAAAKSPRIARRFSNGFDDPRDLFHWFTDPSKAKDYLAEATA